MHACRSTLEDPTFKALDDYRAELGRQLAETPSSIRTVMLLAEASNLDDRAKALGYYRKLTELKPADSTFQIRLASLLRESKQVEEAMRIWEKLIEKDPGPVLQQSFSLALETFKEAKQMSRLGDALVGMPRPKKSFAANYSGGPMWSEYFNQVAADLRNEGKLPQAIKLWRAALEIAGDNEPWQRPNVFMPLVSALIDSGDKPDAAELIERFFFPPMKPKPLFGFDRQMPHGPWTGISSYGDGRMILPALDLLKLARQTGSLDKLREKAVAAASSETDVYAPLFVLFIDSQRRDLAVREEFESRLAGIITRSAERSDPMAAQMLFCLALELQEWPEGRSLALAALQGTQKLVKRSPNYYLEGAIRWRLAEVARELGDDDLARASLRELMAANEKEPAMIQSFRIQQPLRIMEMMADLRMEEEAKVLLKKAKANPQWKQDSTMQRKLADFENRMTLLAGKPGQVRIAVWAVAPSAQPMRTTVCWEIGPALQAERGLTASGEEFSVIEGRYSVELFHGASESAMEKIATLPAAKSRGSWTSAAPLAQGFLLAIARDKENVLFSAKTFLPTGPNLIENPLLAETRPLTLGGGAPSIIRGWPGLNPGSVSYRSDGPQPNARYARLRPPTSAPRESINAQRIKLEPDKKYFLSAWIRASQSDGSARLTGRFFDKDGQEIGTVSTNSTVGDGRWVFVPVRLTRGNRAAAGEQRVPEAAVEFEPVIEPGMGCDVEDLYFGTVVPEIGEPQVDR